MSHTRRQFLTALAVTAAGSSAGCLGRGGTSSGGEPGGEPVVDLGLPCADSGGSDTLPDGRPATAFEGARASPETAYSDGDLPLRETPLHIGHDRSAFVDDDMSGGVGHDGIPSIDDPRFARSADVELPDCERVFGVELDGDVRAYPQRILVQHEIVNDVIGGEPVAVTYCPLTGTAQGFYRGGTEFGVSGRLVNSNLIMWDRATDVRWPQIAATGIEVGGQRDTGDADRLVGQSLREFRVVWTTWRRWRNRHPGTLVLTEETGSARNYNRDPYGSYEPPVSGHYSTDAGRQPNFPLMAYDDAESKRVVVGARTAAGAVAFDKRALMESSVLTGDLGDTPVVAVADEGITTGYVYANPDGLNVERDGDAYAVDGVSAPPGDLPLDRLLAFDAMWFAWYGFYPNTERVEI
ncbi:MAG: hypothetical protein ACI9TI_000558 [Natronomonas sp.]|jgi:hypothetical protein|uniref:DUF3179 domain-containing protein n=1 Tax=Natronomonas sp. TaxID=2184060 RepID=UPI0039899178